MGFKQKWADSLMKNMNYGEKKTPKELVKQRKDIILGFTIIEYIIWGIVLIVALFIIFNANSLADSIING